MTRAVFFDAGHTLLYAHPDIGTIYTETTADMGVQIAPDRFMDVIVPVFREASREYASTSDSSDAQDLAMWRLITRRVYDRLDSLGTLSFEPWFNALYGRFGKPESWKFYDDVEPVLRELRSRGIKVGVVSNWDSRLRRISDAIGLTSMVDFLVISAEAGIRKPDARIFQAALDQAGVRAGEALHVGDHPEEDAEGARRAGLRPVLIDRQKRVTSREFPAGVAVVRSLADLYPLL
ncbi:MAG TPA: HAD-IA family hydrolase [Planctomycetota bacterium]|nr:HAD-IA family hydrolase [Planctomycetota bacterium]